MAVHTFEGCFVALPVPNMCLLLLLFSFSFLLLPGDNRCWFPPLQQRRRLGFHGSRLGFHRRGLGLYGRGLGLYGSGCGNLSLEGGIKRPYTYSYTLSTGKGQYLGLSRTSKTKRTRDDSPGVAAVQLRLLHPHPSYCCGYE